MKRDVESLQEVPLDAPLRLGIAAGLAYPDGSMTASGLRKEAGRGRLAIERVAGKDYTTLSAKAEVRKKCLLEEDRLSLEFRLDSWGDSSRRTVFDCRRQYLRKPIMNRGGRDDLNFPARYLVT